MNKLQKIIGVGAIALTTLGLGGCTPKPEILDMKDLTGDGIPDAIIKAHASAWNSYTDYWLFIGQKDGTYIRANANNDSLNFFTTDKGEIYFLNEQGFYQKAGKR